MKAKRKFFTGFQNFFEVSSRREELRAGKCHKHERT